MSKLYVPQNGKSKIPSKLIVPFRSTAKSAIKAYGSYGGLSKQIWPATGGGGGWDPNNPDWDALGEIVKSGRAKEALTLGQELPSTWIEGDMPKRVIGFADAKVRINGVVRTVPAVQMENLYVSNDWTLQYSQPKYNGSNVRGIIITEVQAKENPEFISCVGESEVKTWIRSSDLQAYTVTYDKLFAPSITQLGAATYSYQANVEGPTMEYYIGANDTKRIKLGYDSPDVSPGPAAYWTRTYNIDSAKMALINTNGTPVVDIYNVPYRLSVMMNFIGRY